jgi:hypothetical protein
MQKYEYQQDDHFVVHRLVLDQQTWIDEAHASQKTMQN